MALTKNAFSKKPVNSWAVAKRLFNYLKNYKTNLILVFFLVTLSVAAQIGGIYYIKILMNNDILPLIGAKNPNLNDLIHSVVIMAITYLSGVAASFLYTRFMVDVSTKILFDIRTDIFTHLQKLPISYTDSRTHGELMSHFTNDADTLRSFLSQSFAQFISAILTFTGILSAMILLSWNLSLIILISLIIVFFIIRTLTNKSRLYFTKQQQELGKVNGYIEEMVTGQKIIKVFNHEHAAISSFDVKNETLYKVSKKANIYANILAPTLVSFSYINYAIIAAGGALLTINEGFDLGTMTSFLLYTRSLNQPINHATQQFNTMIQALAGAERIFKLLDIPVEEDFGTTRLVNATLTADGKIQKADSYTGIWAWEEIDKNGIPNYIQLKGDIIFDNVSFSYIKDKPILKNICLHAKPGQRLALVGSTGAGKTTITNLLNRFYNINDGKILYDGIDIKNIRLSDLRRSLSMVLQDTHLFFGTVADNIRYGLSDADIEKVQEAAALSGADNFIKRLPKTYDTMLTSDASNLSQGQRQLLSISRAALPNPPLLVLDEATSSVDTKTEALIYKAMDTLMKGRTVLAIAHRLSTIQNADIILVLEYGEVIERGNHNELMKQKGRYYQLYTGMIELS